MFRLLVVDDEEIITEALYDVFRGLMPEQLDVCKAYSGEEALEKMEETRIDIVLTDISMPGLNGLQLVERILDFWPDCRVVFLTGHSNFEFVYQAIQLDQVRYILKAEGYEKVTETVTEVINEMKQDQLDKRLKEQTEEQRIAYEGVLQSDFLNGLLEKSKEVCHPSTSFKKEFLQLNIPLDPLDSVYLILTRIDRVPSNTYTKKQHLLSSVRAIWNHHLETRIQSLGIIDRYGDIVWFIQPLQDDMFTLDTPLEEVLELIQEECLKSLGLSLQFSISASFIEWENVSEKYEKLRQTQQLKLKNGISIIKREQADTGLKGNAVSNQKMDILMAHLEAGRKENFFAEFHEILQAIDQRNYQQVVDTYYLLALVLHSYLTLNGWHNRMIEQKNLFRIDQHPSTNDGFQYLEKIARDIFQMKSMDNRDRAAKIIDRVSSYIETHLSEDLSLARLAEIHYFNPSYLSHLFKREKGINLSEYIDTCRIRKAKELLQNPELKVREVSLQVGYHTAHSFTRFFKKITAMTPKEYRESLPVRYKRHE
ncbi:response regulator [Gracilibacillus alcaliphilus]|uniref:response regulator n=1 Tax=Gracilibacillus alcaliphilus TaxID=1401441 RepID=UPI00195E7E10|nr:response regulator [Gracilibacillus alcaliphilus]MBM7677695.1 two-component system response regulator YesN [Gracilibacillus alcaliphilus]